MVPGVMVKTEWKNETQRTFQSLKLFSMWSKSDQIDVMALLFKPKECTTSRMITVQTAFLSDNNWIKWIIVTKAALC